MSLLSELNQKVSPTSIVRYVQTQQIEPAELEGLKTYVPPALFSLILSYAGDPTLPNDARTYQLILDAYRGQEFLSRFTVNLPAKIADEECEARVTHLYVEVMNLAKPHKISIIQLSGPVNRGMAPLALNRIMEEVRLVEKRDLASIFWNPSYGQGGSVREECPQVSELLSKFESEDCETQFEEISKWMDAHPQELAKVKRLDINCSSVDMMGSPRDPISTLPLEIARFVNLEELDLHGCKVLPNWIDKFVHLRSLGLWNNELTRLPDSIGNLAKLMRLDIFSQTLRVLPDCIDKLRNRGCVVRGPN